MTSADARAGWVRREVAVRREQVVALALSISLCLAAATALSNHWMWTTVVPSFPFVPIAMTWSIFDLLTACFLLARLYVSGRPVFGWVGAAYGCSGLLTVSYLAAYLGLLGTARHTVGDQQIAGALYIVWHTLFAFLVAIGIFFDGRRPQVQHRERAPRAVLATAAAVIVTATFVTAAACIGRNHLPIFALNGVMQPALMDAMLAIVVLSGASLATVLIVCRRRLHGLALWLCVALLCSMLEAKLNSVSLELFSVAWDVGKLLTLSTSSFVMIHAMVMILRMYASISEIMAVRSQDAGARLRAIWQIATSEGLSERDHLQLILDVAASNIRSRNNVYGFVSRLEEDAIYVTGVCAYGDPAVHEDASAAYRPDSKIPLYDSLHAELYAAGSTMIWQPPANVPAGLARASGWRSVIGTVIQVGARSHFVVFGSPDRLETERFVESDVAFVEVVASILSRRYSENMQLERMQFQSEHDALTGVYNRTQFRRLGRLSTAARLLRAAMLIDLDGFAGINQRLGQMTGDDILVEVAASLASVDQRDVVARISGDEFAVLVQSPDDEDRDLPSAFKAYEQLFRKPFPCGDGEGKAFATVTASIGIALIDDSELGFEQLLSRAAVALEHSKRHGGHSATVFGPDLQPLLYERSVERADLIEALEADTFFLEYQPTFELNTQTLSGVEALVRWQHPTRGVVYPDALLPAIRRANLLGELTFWVMRRVAKDFGGAELPPSFRCFFNVPSQVLENEMFISHLNQLLFANPDLAGHLGIEVTESEVMHKVEQAVETLSRARQLGVTVAVDDFGSGYSSLTYLKRLPVDVLKLDKSFIQGLPEDAKDVALAELFLTLTKQLGLVSLGEGIETQVQADWLREHGCMIGQGFLFSKPISHGDFMNLLAAEQTRALG